MKSVQYIQRESIEIVSPDKADEFIKELFESLFSRYQVGLETLLKGSYFFFDCVYLLNYRCHKIDLYRGENYKDSSNNQKKSKKTTNDPVNEDNKCFQYAAAEKDRKLYNNYS